MSGAAAGGLALAWGCGGCVGRGFVSVGGRVQPPGGVIGREFQGASAAMPGCCGGPVDTERYIQYRQDSTDC